MAKSTTETSISDTINQALADEAPPAETSMWGGFKVEVGVIPESARGGQTKYDWGTFPAPTNPDDPATWPSVYIKDKAGAKSIYTSIRKFREKRQADGAKPVPEFTVSVVKDPESKEVLGVRIIRRL